MISALNLRQLLNGNKHNGYVINCFVAIACAIILLGVGQTTAAEKPIRVAFLLPFNTESIKYDTLGNITGNVTTNTQMALNYYKGAMLALDSLSNSGLTIITRIYDTKSDSNVVHELLFNNAEMLNTDIIIGPFFMDELRVANRFSQRFHIPVVSPYVTSTSFVSKSPEYILSKPTLATHCKALSDYIDSIYKPSRVIILLSESQQDKNYYALFENALKQTNSKPSIYKLSDSSSISQDKIELYLVPGSTNIIFISSTNETFISKLTARLETMSTQYQIVLVGMPQWRESQTLKGSQLSKLHCIISHYADLDKNTTYFNHVNKAYINKYALALNEFSMDGYNDTFYFISNQADDSEWNFTRKPKDALCKQIIIKPRYKSNANSTSTTVDYLENTYVNILQYRDGRLEDVR